MPPRTPKLLEDIRDAAQFIQDVTQGETLEGYSQNRMLRQAVERNFEIIGEAVRRLDHHDTDIARRIGPHAQIVAFRNALIHGYDTIDNDAVWGIVRHNLPDLLVKIKTLIEEGAE